MPPIHPPFLPPIPQTQVQNLVSDLASKLTSPIAISDVTNLQTDLNAKQDTSQKGQANGYADLDASSKLTKTLASKTQVPNIDESQVTNLVTDLENIGMKKLASQKLVSAVTQISLTGLPAYEFYKVIVNIPNGGNVINPVLRLNNDSNTHYTTRITSNGGADTTNTSQSRVGTGLADHGAYLIIIEITCNTVDESLIYMICNCKDGNLTNVAPNRSITNASWVQATQINEIDILDVGVSALLPIGTTVTVYGYNI